LTFLFDAIEGNKVDRGTKAKKRDGHYTKIKKQNILGRIFFLN
jgi:hypothetical protein